MDIARYIKILISLAIVGAIVLFASGLVGKFGARTPL